MAVLEEASAAQWGTYRVDPDTWPRWYVRGALSLDFLVALAAGSAALFVRFGEIDQPSVLPYVFASLALPFLWVMAVALSRGYETRFLGLGSDEFRRVLNAGVSLTAAVAILAYAAKIDIARGYVVLALPLLTVGNLGARYGLRQGLHRLRARGLCMRRVVVVGHEGTVVELIQRLRRERYHGMHIVAACLPRTVLDDDGGTVRHLEDVPVYGDFSEVALVVEQVAADAVAVLACPELDGVSLRRLAWQLEKSRTDLVVAPALMDVAGPRTTIRPVAGLPLLHVEHPELAGVRQLIKGLFDRVVAAAVLLVLSPLLAAIVVAVRLTSCGPAIFRQTRVGRDGREFTVYKFRTMYVDAERRREELLVHNEHDGVLFKIRNDPRVTPLGTRLRRYSLDELPQLVNVLLGQMSLVGPRPPLPCEVAKYGYDVRRRLVVRPGMTGLWQISGRADLSWEEAVRLDLRYVENWSLALDLLILWKTWRAVLRGAGAY
ncbi:MAG: exopolysaccharide biosynthesis polyprenyl glycosylphosphotransferase [Streptosporangiales bacterium]|nr:exopolysaccharide biosynthesis polyprenyl glycosylphosphotransferase [Streptosporangiales bacterium]